MRPWRYEVQDYWRGPAEEARNAAADMRSPEARCAMLSVAEQYVALAIASGSS
jgi:hypothetical protein